MRCVLQHLGVLAACLVGAAATTAQTPPQGPPPPGVARVLIDRRLQEHAVRITALDARTLTYTDSAGLVRSEPLAEFIAILPDHAATSDSAAGGALPGFLPVGAASAQELTLADGQRLVGRFGSVLGDAPAEVFTWEHPVLGPLEVRLDDVRRLQLGFAEPALLAPGGPRQPGDTDLVILANGDRLEGFVEGLLREGPAVRLVTGETARDIPFERIGHIHFQSNPAGAPPEGSLIAWLRDGSILACRALRTTRAGELTIELAMREGAPARPAEATMAQGALALADLVAADLRPGLLTPLASLPPAEQRPAAERRWSPPVTASQNNAPLHLEDLHLPGPLAVEWDLPPGASRFAATAELPRSMWDWGDAEVVVALAAQGRETELFRQRLSAERPAAAINLSLERAPAGARLRIRLEAGPYGAVQDRIVLRRPVLLRNSEQ
ncbi:MAG: hypothetical protein WD749_15260 [Phycisphaerales bacterium]